MAVPNVVDIKLAWNQLTSEVMTSLFLYGTMKPPQELNDRVKDPDRQVTVTLDTSGFMGPGGPGSYANPTEVPFLKILFGDPLILKQYMQVRGLMDDHPYTIGELKQLALNRHVPLGDHFKQVLQQYTLDTSVNNYTNRTYIYNTEKFDLSDDTIIIFNTSKAGLTPVVKNLTFKPESDNFDFNGGDSVTNVGNTQLLIPNINPQSIGKAVIINFDDSPSPIRNATYTAADYAADKDKYNSINSSKEFATIPAYFAMNALVNSLVNSKTVEYSRDGKNIIYGTTGNDIRMPTTPRAGVIMVGGTGNDALVGSDLADIMMGGKDNDSLRGGDGMDQYIFKKDDGHDVIEDSNGAGVIILDGVALPSAEMANYKGETKQNGHVVEVWSVDGGRVIYTLDALAKTLLISGSALGTSSDIKITKVDVPRLRNSGYLGISLKSKKNLALVEGTGSNVWSQRDFDIANLAGKSSSLIENTGKTFTVYLNQTASAGDVFTLSLSDLQDKFWAILGDSTVAANGAVIKLVDGQTQVSFALVQHGDLEADASVALSVTYTGIDGTISSNSFGVDLKDTGDRVMTYNGDQRPSVKSDDGVTFDWTVSVYQPDGSLSNSTAEEGFSDSIIGSAGRDKIFGLAGNDALDGGAGADEIEGGDGDDLIGGGAGSDHILGGDGNDYIASSATLNVGRRRRTDDTWHAPNGEQVKSQGALWAPRYTQV